MDSLSEVAWRWEPPRGSGEGFVREMGEGLVFLLEGGAFALSGETGKELWSYYDPSQNFVSEVTDNGDYVVLHDKETFQTVLLEKETGKVSQEYILDMDEFDHTYRVRAGHRHDALSGITSDAWVVRWQDQVISYDLGAGGELWSAVDVANCSDQGSVDALSVQDDVVIAATTCYEQPEDADSVEWIQGWDFTSEMVGLAPDTGKELWRVEHTMGRSPVESLQRDISFYPGGLVGIHYLDSYDLEPSLLDIEEKEATDLETRSLLWTSPDGSRLGLWDTETGEYRIQDRSGNVERTLDREIVSMDEDMVTDGHRVGLAGGVLYLSEWMEDASSPEGFARFEGFDGSTVFTWDEAESLSVTNALSVPGAVAVAYRADGEPGVMGLR